LQKKPKVIESLLLCFYCYCRWKRNFFLFANNWLCPKWRAAPLFFGLGANFDAIDRRISIAHAFLLSATYRGWFSMEFLTEETWLSYASHFRKKKKRFPWHNDLSFPAKQNHDLSNRSDWSNVSNTFCSKCIAKSILHLI